MQIWVGSGHTIPINSINMKYKPWEDWENDPIWPSPRQKISEDPQISTVRHPEHGQENKFAQQYTIIKKKFSRKKIKTQLEIIPDMRGSKGSTGREEPGRKEGHRVEF